MLRSPSLRHRLTAAGLCLAALCLLVPPAAAQSVESVVDRMKQRYRDQIASVDNYVVETDLYTSYHRKVMKDGTPSFETATRLKGQGGGTPFGGAQSPASQAQFEHLDRLARHATYGGTETVDGAPAHVLRVDDPSKVDPSMSSRAERLTYYVDAEQYLPVRIQMEMPPMQGGPMGGGAASPPGGSAQGGSAQGEASGPPQRVTIDLLDYRSVEGLMIPYTMKIETNLDETLTPQQRQQLEQLQKKLEQMPESQRKQMERMLGDQMERLQKMAAGEPTTIQVRDVRVNEGLPDGVFSESSGSR
jgi:outer membrane lipoprotein-sorting protein